MYDKERHELRKKVGVQGMRSNTLLGDSQIIKKTVEYIKKWAVSSLTKDNSGKVSIERTIQWEDRTT